MPPRQLKCASLCLTTIGIQPGKQAADAPCRQGNAGISSTVIQIDRVSISPDSLSARKHNVIHVSTTFITRLRAEDPGISALQTDLRLFKIEERQAEAIDASRCGLPHAVVNHEPTFCRFNRRRAEANLVRIPPSAAPCFQDDLMASPMPQIGRIGNPHMSAQGRHGPVNQRPTAADSPR